MTSLLEIRSGGKFLTGWISANVFRSAEACSGTFGIEVPFSLKWPIARGSRVELFLDGEPFAVGHVEKLKATVSTSGKVLEIEGRDLTGDLVDCSIEIEGGELRGLTLTEIVATFVEPWGLEVLVGRGVETGEPIARVAWTPGESVWTVLEKVLRERGILAFPGPAGELVLATPANNRTTRTLTLPGDLLSLELSADDSQRFRTYVVRGQALGADLDEPETTTSAIATAEDRGARAGRVLSIPADGRATIETCTRLAQWHAATRAARATSTAGVVKGWRDRAFAQGGKVWNLLDLVHLQAPELELAADFLIASTRFTFDGSGGETTSIEFVRPDAYLAEPVVQPDDPSDILGIDVDDDGGGDE